RGRQPEGIDRHAQKRTVLPRLTEVRVGRVQRPTGCVPDVDRLKCLDLAVLGVGLEQQFLIQREERRAAALDDLEGEVTTTGDGDEVERVRGDARLVGRDVVLFLCLHTGL